MFKTALMIISKYLKTFSIFGLILFYCSSCIDEIDSVLPNSADIDTAVSIQGRIVKGNPSYVSVKIQSISNFSGSLPKVDAKEVTVEDDAGNQLVLERIDRGSFFMEIPDDHPTFRVTFGKSYKVNVATEDNRNFTSSLDRLFPCPEPDDLTVQVVDVEAVDARGNDRIVQQFLYSISTPLTPGDFRIRARLAWKVKATYKITDSPFGPLNQDCNILSNTVQKSCYVDLLPLTNQVTLDGPSLGVDRIDNFEILKTTINVLHAEGFYMTVTQQSLDKEAYRYHEQLRNLGDRTGDPFESPVGKIISNISSTNNEKEKVFGFFYATEEKVRRIYVSPELANFPTPSCQAFQENGDLLPRKCCDCTSLKNSTTTKPEWWIQ